MQQAISRRRFTERPDIGEHMSRSEAYVDSSQSCQGWDRVLQSALQRDMSFFVATKRELSSAAAKCNKSLVPHPFSRDLTLCHLSFVFGS